MIKDRLPNRYLPELMPQAGEKHVRAILGTHLISSRALDTLLRPSFTAEDFQEFLEERRQTILAAIEDLLIKERLDLAPALRELDARMEQAELGLRALVVAALADDASLVPPHLWPKVEGRIQAEIRKSPYRTEADFAGLGAKLQYFDLREVQDLICSKSTWDRFAGAFGTKEALAVKFSQLAELRNGIRHSRSVDEVTRKEGEAAILWFEECLKRTRQGDGILAFV